MKQGLNMIPRLLLLTLMAGLSACSSVKDLTNVNLWPFGSNADAPRVYLPANSVPYMCEGNKKFFVRMLDKGASAWLILPDREVLLTQSGTSKVYSNGISKLDLTTDDVSLDVNETNKYVACKANGVAKVTKVEPVAQQAAVQAEPAKSEMAKKSEVVAKAEMTAKPVDSVKPEPKQVAEKGWFDKLKFWESDEQVSVPKADPKPIIVEGPKTGVVTPVKEKATPSPMVEEVAAPAVEETKAAESASATPVVEAASESSSVDLPAMIREVAQQGNQEEQSMAPAEEKASAYQTAVAQTLIAWANAWKSKNTDAYLSFYSAKFTPEGMSQKAWIAQRKQRVSANSAEIKLVLDKVNVEADAKKAEVTFIQHYTSGKFSDTVAKVLNFENENGHWFIVKESVQSKK